MFVNYTCIPILLLGCGKQEKKMFSSLSADRTGVYFSNDLEISDDVNIVEYMYAYNGGGVAIGDINNDGLLDIYLTANQLPNKIIS